MKKNIFLYKVIIVFLFFLGLNALYSFYHFEDELKAEIPQISHIANFNEDSDILFIEYNDDEYYLYGNEGVSMLSTFFTPGKASYNIAGISMKTGDLPIIKAIMESNEMKDFRGKIVLDFRISDFAWERTYHPGFFEVQKRSQLLSKWPHLLRRIFYLFHESSYSEKERNNDIQGKWKEPVLEHLNMDNIKSIREWDRAMLLKGIRDEEGNYLDSQTSLACHYIKKMGSPVDFDSHPYARHLEDIMILASSKNWELILNLVPENIEDMTNLIASPLDQIFNANKENLISLAQQYSVQVIDNTELLAAEYFIDRDRVSTLISEEGKRKWMQNITKELITDR